MRRVCLAAVVALGLCGSAIGAPVDPSFTYQGQLTSAGAAASGDVDLRFRLYDAMSGGAQIGTEQSWTVTLDSDGRFVVDLDFGPGAFAGDERWLEIDVAVAGSGSFTTLNPRQPMQPAPYALYALDGNPGPQGDQGPVGPEGPQGPVGPEGPQGDQGDEGPQGVQGVQGPIGPEGPEGPQGPQGVQGPIGMTGPAGTTSWLGLLDIPSDIADGDDNTTYSAGTALQLTGTQFSVQSSGIGPVQLAFNTSSLERVSANRIRAGGGPGTLNMPFSNSKLGIAASNEPTGTLQVFSGFDISATDTDGYLILGGTGAENMAFDTNELMVRNNGVASTLNLNFDGGDVILGGSSSTGQIGIGQASPTDRLHVSANAGESALRVQVDGVTRLRVNANGGISIGANNTSVPAGQAYVVGNLGIGESTPDERLHVFVADEVNDGILVQDDGGSQSFLAPRTFSANSNFTFDNTFDFTFNPDDFLVFADRLIDLNALSDINIDSENVARIDGTLEIELNSASVVDINAGTTLDIDATNRIDLLAGADVDIDGSFVTVEGTRFNGNAVSIGTTSTSFLLTVNGTAGKPGGGLWSVFSDRRLKNNIRPMRPVLDRLTDLEGFNFEYRDPDHFSYMPGEQHGWVAQQVREVFPEWIEQGEDGYLFVNPKGYESMVVQAIKELRSEKDREIETLRSENRDLRERLEKLENLLLD